MKKRNAVSVMAKLIILVKPLSGFMILAVAMGLAGNLCAALIPVFGGFAALDALNIKTVIDMPVIFVLLALFALARGVLRYTEQTCNHYIAFKLLALIRDRVFKALRRLCPAKLEGRDRGNLISLITSDVELLEVFYAHTVSPCAIAALFTVVMCLIIGSYHYLLGLLALAAYIAVGVVSPIIASKRGGTTAEELRRSSGDLASYVLDSLRGINETIQYDDGKNRAEETERKNSALSGLRRRMKRCAGVNEALTNSIILISDLLMTAAAAVLFLSGEVGIDGVLISVIALASSFGPCAALASLGSTLQSTLAAGGRVLDILEETPVVSEISSGENITFDGASADKVGFSYDGDEVLTDVSVDVPKGAVIGISGKSGSGKSTLLKLMMRFWSAGSGEIKISGRNIENINTDSLRDSESLVTQETHIFRDSIKNNLLIAKPDASDDELVAACRKASVHDFITGLPNGYDTPAGELGDSLSDGEKQRIGLARAFLHDSPFMLLDEPTSNLDSLNEARILKSLCDERKDKTVMIVSHRESTLKFADRVYTVENGRVS